MSIVRLANPDEIRPGHVVMIVLVGLTLAGSCLLTSGAERTVLPDGAQEWPPDSLFRILVELLNLDYTQVTPTGSEIKNLAFGLGAAIAFLSVGIAVAFRPRGGEEVEDGDTVITESSEIGATEPLRIRKHIHPIVAAQLLMLLYLAWSFASCLWSDARDIAFYGSLELTLYVLWSFALAYGLNRASARFGAYALVAVLSVTAAIAIRYTIERNPTLRADYPIGNPTFLAACLLPGMLVATSIFAAKVQGFARSQRVRCVMIALVCLGAVVLMGDAFDRTESRGAYVGLFCGIAALLFFALNKRGKVVVLALMLIGGIVGAWFLLPKMMDHSPTGRDASLRVRFYSWSYAGELIGRRPFLGHGQGGYVRKADALVGGEDVLGDWVALEPRIAHAHNEWLEVCTDLGSVGLVLVLAALLFTLVAGAITVRGMPGVNLHWVLVGLLASLTALFVEECFGVGLRVTGLPPVYYTVIGLTWALCMPEQPSLIRRLSRSPPGRIASITFGGILGLTAAHLAVRDFQSARAQYNVAEALDNLEWQDAIDLAETASAHRLSPQRRLVALAQLASTFQHIANVHNAAGLRRAAVARQSDPPDQPLMVLGEQDLEMAGSCHHRGTEVLRELVRKAPNFYNSNWFEYGFSQIMAELARARGDSKTARQYDQYSAAALKRELSRRPYDANMAALYVYAARSVISLEEIFVTLARPLRYNPVPGAYRTIATRLLTIPDFKREFQPIYERARATDPSADPQWEDPFAPETLRLSAVVWTEDGADERAERALADARALYASLGPRFNYATAACLAELAERRFLNDPHDSSRALADARAAIEHAPPSYEGRQLAEWVRNLSIAMQLASGDEDAARAILLDLAPVRDEAGMRAALSSAYVSLVTTVSRLDGKAHADRLSRWITRALELDMENVPAWLQGAQMAFHNRNDAECVRCLREADRHGADRDFIRQFVDSALRERPASVHLRSYRELLSTQFGRPFLNSDPPSEAMPSSPSRPGE